MMFLILGLSAFLLPILLHLAIRLRLGIPMLYAVLALTVFHGWYQAHTALADGIFFVLVGLTALSWMVTAARKVYELIDGYLTDRAMANLLSSRIRQARAEGETVVNSKGFWL